MCGAMYLCNFRRQDRFKKRSDVGRGCFFGNVEQPDENGRREFWMIVDMSLPLLVRAANFNRKIVSWYSSKLPVVSSVAGSRYRSGRLHHDIHCNIKLHLFLIKDYEIYIATQAINNF